MIPPNFPQARCFSSFCAIRLPHALGVQWLNPAQSHLISISIGIKNFWFISLLCFKFKGSKPLGPGANFVARLADILKCCIKLCVEGWIPGLFYFCCWWTCLLVSIPYIHSMTLIAFLATGWYGSKFEALRQNNRMKHHPKTLLKSRYIKSSSCLSFHYVCIITLDFTMFCILFFWGGCYKSPRLSSHLHPGSFRLPCPLARRDGSKGRTAPASHGGSGFSWEYMGKSSKEVNLNGKIHENPK